MVGGGAPERRISVKEADVLCGLRVENVRWAIKTGQLRAERIQGHGRPYRLTVRDLNAWLEERNRRLASGGLNVVKVDTTGQSQESIEAHRINPGSLSHITRLKMGGPQWRIAQERIAAALPTEGPAGLTRQGARATKSPTDR